MFFLSQAEDHLKKRKSIYVALNEKEENTGSSTTQLQQICWKISSVSLIPLILPVTMSSQTFPSLVSNTDKNPTHTVCICANILC